MVTANVQLTRDTINHNYQSAVGQSGIFAGDSGFNIIVSGNTMLKGGALASDNLANSHLRTASLTYEDLTNKQSTKTSSMSVSASYGSSGSLTSMLANNAKANALGNAGSLLAGGNKNSNESSQTLAYIQGNVEITGTGDAAVDAKSRAAAGTLTSRDAATANGALTNNLTLADAGKLQQELQTDRENARAAQLVGQVMTEKIGDISQGKWDEGSWQKTALHAAAGAIEAAVAKGDIGTGALAGAVNEQLIGLIKDDLRKAVDSQYPKNPSKEQAAQAEAEYRTLMEAASTLTGLTVGALASGGDTKTATMAGNIALTATDNNYLKHNEIKDLAKAKSDCAAGNNSQACARVKELQSLSAERDAALDACSGNASARCEGLRQDVRTAYADIIRQGDAFKVDSFYTYGSESSKTKNKAMETLSTSEYYKGTASGLLDSLIVSPIKSLIEASRPLAMQQAYTEGNATLQDVQQMQDQVKSNLNNVAAVLSNPAAWSKIPQAMRDSIADAVEKGDAYALGKIDGEVLGFVGSMAVPGGGIVGSTGKVTKTTEVLSDVAKVGEKTVETANRLVEKGGQGYATAKYLEGVEQKLYTPDNVIGQSLGHSCGAASCRMAADLSDIPEVYIRDALGTTENGTRFSSMPDGLKSLGFEGTATYTENATAKSLAEASQSGSKSVVSVWQGGGESHAIVVDRISGGMAYIRDPWPVGTGSSYAISVESLQKAMTGRAVVVHPAP